MAIAQMVLLVVASTACGAPTSRAAEPAVAPAATATPAGVVEFVGASPEGVVFDPATHLVVVAVRSPDRLQLLDPLTLQVRRSVALPAAVRHLQLAGPGGPVLVPCQDADQVLQVSLPTGEVAATTAVQSHPHDAAAAAGGLVVVGNEFGHSLSVISRGRVQRTIHGLDQPGGVVAVGSRVAVIDVARFTVSVYDPASGRRVKTVGGGAGPTHGATTSAGRLVVVDTRGSRLLTYSLNPLKQISSLRLPGSPYGIDIDRVTDTAWVTLTGSNQVVGLDVSRAIPVVVARYPTVEQPNSVAVSPGSGELWVTGTRTGQVQHISR